MEFESSQGRAMLAFFVWDCINKQFPARAARPSQIESQS
jgi:hypothetical protein